MGMRLLPKSEIDRAKASDKKREIDEGAKLARRIDNLREVAAAEELSLETYRRETLTKINEEITPKVKERDKLDEQIKAKKEWLCDADLPLEEKRLALDSRAEALDRGRENLDEREADVARQERDTEVNGKKANALLARATTREELADTALKHADAAKKEAELALATARRVKEEALAFKDKAHKEFTHRDLIASGRERDVSIKEKAQAEEKERIADEWKLLEDRKAMFERDLKRKQ